jgi:DNA-binding MarR family transcriptional regulator
MPEARKTPGIAKAKSERAREVSEIFGQNYMDYQYRFVEFFVEHLEDVSRAFRGDLQQMMVLAIIGQVKLRVVRDAILAGEDPAMIPPERCGIGASRIADVTAIPRQTVRRKLELLEQRGWIERLDDSTWTLRYRDGVSEAHVGLSDVDRRSIDRVARVFAELEALVTARS